MGKGEEGVKDHCKMQRLVEQRKGSVINGDKQALRGCWEAIIVTAFTGGGVCRGGGRHRPALVTDK